MKIPAKSIFKCKSSKFLHGIPESANCKLKRQVHKSGRFLNDTSQEFKREKGKVNSTNMKSKRQVHKSKRLLNDAGQDFRREKQKTWVNYLV